jgi:Putative Flp pilus-assembly TadE/G-like
MNTIVKTGKSYLWDKRGAVAPIFGLMAIPMLAISGAAIDIGQAISAQQELQKALDTAAVAVCSVGGQQNAEDVLRAYLGAELEKSKLNVASKEGAQGPSVSPYEVVLEGTAFNTAEGSFNPTAKATIPTSLLKLIGIQDIDIAASTGVKCGAKRLELSVVVDVTGSMDWYAGDMRKIDGLKLAATDMLDIFRNNMNAGVTKIGLVPFSESVSLPDSMASQVRDYPSHDYTFRDRHGHWSTYYLTNCVTERNGNHRFTNDAPGPGRWLNPMYTSSGNCKPTQNIIPLTTNHAQLQSVIDDLVPSGGTAGHIGTAFGWYMLSTEWSGVWPTESVPEEDNEDELIKATIIMTDGDYNTQYCHGVNDTTINCASPNGTSSAQAAELCERIKDDNIVVYTIGFGIREGSDQETLLRNCASDSSKYFSPYNGNELRAAFKTIGKQLSGGQAGHALIQR